MFNTVDTKSWNLQATNFYVGFDQHKINRVINFNPHLPYIYIPNEDWNIIAARVQEVYHGVRCEYDENVCKFNKRCSMIPNFDNLL